MGEYVIKLPDVGEGVAEAELVEWHIEEGQSVREDDVLAAVMTDKATVEIPAPVDGKVIWRGAEIGQVLSVGSPLIRLEVTGEGNVSAADKAIEADLPSHASSPKDKGSDPAASPLRDKSKTDSPAEHVAQTPKQSVSASQTKSFPQARQGPSPLMTAPRAEGEKPLASPAVRKRALEGGLDLRQIAGSGPAGRISHEDLDAVFSGEGAQAAQSGSGPLMRPDTSLKEVPVIGLRRKIAEKMSLAKSRIPHITYVEEVDMTALEALRGQLNAGRRADQPKLTLLPFLMRAMAKAIGAYPHINTRYDDEAGKLYQYGGLHMGIAAQTDNGLVVPVVRHVEALGLWQCAHEIGRLSAGAKEGKLTREELSGSTITITSLGKMGGIVTTPVINHPEVAIIGVNKIRTLPHWDGQAFQPRQMMNLSSSFDHRVIDGWDAALFIQKIKSLLEVPALIFIEEAGA